jgi:hypothetical protein
MQKRYIRETFDYLTLTRGEMAYKIILILRFASLASSECSQESVFYLTHRAIVPKKDCDIVQRMLDVECTQN